MDSNEGLKVSDIIHKAFLSVDETGSEGAAATCLYFSSVLHIKMFTFIDFYLNCNFFFFVFQLWKLRKRQCHHASLPIIRLCFSYAKHRQIRSSLVAVLRNFDFFSDFNTIKNSFAIKMFNFLLISNLSLSFRV